jgi:TetR/AcrR family transcriptional repressor of nem operon
MNMIFKYEKQDGKSVMDSIRTTLVFIAKNKPLVRYGCPLYRLMVELSPVDKEFDVLLSSKVNDMQKSAALLLQRGKDIDEFNDSLDTEAYARFLLSSVWGILSLSPTLSSSKNFIKQSRYILKELESYKN